MGYTGSSDRLVVSGGITPHGITNESFAYEPATDTWSRLPASNNVLYRGGSTCGLTRVGGSMLSGFVPVDFVEHRRAGLGTSRSLDVARVGADG
jgi:hypothetical protein